METVDCDVAIAGGGPAGSAAAMTLASAGYAAVVLESSHYQQPRAGETLPPSTAAILHRMQLWDEFTGLKARPSFGNQSAWGSPELESESFVFSPYGVGWHLERQRFDAMLADCAQRRGAIIFKGARLIECKPDRRSGWALTAEVEAGTVAVRARAVIDASGRKAVLAKSVGARRILSDHLVGIAATYAGSLCDGGCTLVEATECGWWYCAAIPPDDTVVMFMTDADLCRSGSLTQPAVFEARLAETTHIRRRVNTGRRLWGPVVLCAVSQLLSRKHLGPPWLAAGDAAMAVDPLSSSGIARGLETGEAAALAMKKYFRGDLGSLLDYEQRICADYCQYLQRRAAYYALETRWPASVFWQRRRLQ